MPIYEFYCRRCDRVYNFFSPRVDTEKIPYCPHCKTVKLKRQMSLFARLSGKEAGGESGEGAMPPFDEAKMEKAMALLAREADKINEDDPRQAAMLMRKLTDATGISMGEGMEEALSRMEKGEDPDRIEQEMGDLLTGEEPFAPEAKGGQGPKKRAPAKIDETLYDL